MGTRRISPCQQSPNVVSPLYPSVANDQLKKIDVLEAAKKHFLHAKDTAGVEEAMQRLYQARHDFAFWWDSQQKLQGRAWCRQGSGVG